MKRLAAPLLLLVVLAGCSASPGTATSGAPATESAVAAPSLSASASSSASEAIAPSEMSSEAPTPLPAAGGTATDFCGAFKELQTVSEVPGGDMVSVGARFRAAAADMRKFAPAEIMKEANTYADVIDNIGKTASAGSLDKASLSQAVSAGVAGNSKDIAATAVWVAKNCPS
ncbi:MAG: hypothetical protein ACOH17_09945 [Cellulomonas sp.]